MAAVEGGYQLQLYRAGGRVSSPRASMASSSPSSSSSSARSSSRASSSVLSRPGSALARGIQITEFRDAKVNPEPVPVEESDLLLEEYLSPRKLRALTGIENLSEVHYLEMKVDTRDTSLGNFGTHLANLTQLKLSNSIISSARDLGSSLSRLRVLWLARCGTEDLDGLSSMNSLQELYLAYNDIRDISPCSLLENLRILDLEGNNIDEISQVHFLNTCAKLRNLTLEGNPVCVTPSPDEASPAYDYRAAVQAAVPQLDLLDDEPVLAPAEGSVGPRRAASVFEDDWALIDELLQDGTVLGDDDTSATVDATFTHAESRPLSALRPTTGYRPGSALKNYHGTGIRPGTRCGRPGTGQPGTAGGRPGTNAGRPGTARLGTASRRPGSGGRPGSGEEPESTEDASELTRGGVVCGNPSKALRARHNTTKTHHNKAAKLKAQMKFRPEHTHDNEPAENTAEMKVLLQDLSEWRHNYQVKQKQITESKAPQVLRIDHDDAVSLSDSDGSVASDANDASDEDDTPRGHHHNSIMSRGAAGETSQPDIKPKSRGHRVSLKSRSRSKGRYDESFDAPEEGSTMHVQHEDRSQAKSHSTEYLRQATLPGHRLDELRPLSNPALPTKAKLRADPATEKALPRKIDPLNPIVRASIRSPETRVPSGPRADTAKSALGQPPNRIRKGLSNVPILPSKFTK